MDVHIEDISENVGLEVDWVEVEEQHDKFGLSPAAPSQASRMAVPVYSGDRQVGKATTTAVLRC